MCWQCHFNIFIASGENALISSQYCYICISVEYHKHSFWLKPPRPWMNLHALQPFVLWWQSHWLHSMSEHPTNPTPFGVYLRYATRGLQGYFLFNLHFGSFFSLSFMITSLYYHYWFSESSSNYFFNQQNSFYNRSSCEQFLYFFAWWSLFTYATAGLMSLF